MFETSTTAAAQALQCDASIRMSAHDPGSAGLILLATTVAVAAFLPTAKRLAATAVERVALAIALAALAVTLVPGLGAPFSAVGVAGALVAIATRFGLLVCSCPASDFSTALPLHRSTIMVLIALIATYVTLLMTNGGWLHYDYLHAALQSIDLARAGKVDSEWLRSVGCDGWYIRAQGLSATVDAAEAVFSGCFSGNLSRLVVLALSVWIVARLDRRDVKPLFVAVVGVALCALQIDCFRSFRPHSFVGLSLAAFGLEFGLTGTASTIRAVVFLMILAVSKRDGVVLSALLIPAVALRFAKPWLGGIRMVAMVALALGACMLILVGIGRTAEIGGQSVLTALAEAARSPGAAGGALRWPVVASLILLCIVTILDPGASAGAHGRRSHWHWTCLLAAVWSVVLLSSVLLDGKARWNEGTVLRKLDYFLVVPMLCALSMFSATSASPISGPWMTRVRGREAFRMLLAASLSTWLWIEQAGDREGWQQAALRAIDYYRAILPTNPTRTIGIYEPEPESWAETPFSEITAYRFPLLIAACGRPVTWSADLMALQETDITILPASSGTPCKFAAQGVGRTVLDLDSGLCLLAKPEIVSEVPDVHCIKDEAGRPILGPLDWLPWPIEPSMIDSAGAAVSEMRAWRNLALTYLAWPPDERTWAAPLTFRIPAIGRRIYCLQWKDHPLGDAAAKEIFVTVDGETRGHRLVRQVAPGLRSVPIGTERPFHVSIIHDDSPVMPPWSSPHVTIFDLRLLVDGNDRNRGGTPRR